MKKILLSFLLSISVYAWDLKKDSEGIKVYTRSVENSGLKEFKAITIHQGTLSSIVAVLGDEGAFATWYPDCKESRRLKTNSDTDFIGYLILSAPFPVSNRDSITQIKISQDKNTKVVTMTINALPTYLPEKEGLIRVTKIKGLWQLTPNADGTTTIYYQVHAEPGGSLPEWLANTVVTDQPFKTLRNLKKKAQEEKYINAKLTYIQD
ncbi:MAG: START domain-containing protein [Leptospiraceae bacterium]|nr:START domain-containing protein [Leptospiraceae bacterium]